MTKQKKLSAVQTVAKEKRQREYMTVFMNGKQKRVKKSVTIDGMETDEFIRNNADPIWLHQNEMWEYLELPEGDDLTTSDPDHFEADSHDLKPAF
jgi:16S rRNA U516 pseudouridylate synthase RsuA-like enzyme